MTKKETDILHELLVCAEKTEEQINFAPLEIKRKKPKKNGTKKFEVFTFPSFSSLKSCPSDEELHSLFAQEAENGSSLQDVWDCSFASYPTSPYFTPSSSLSSPASPFSPEDQISTSKSSSSSSSSSSCTIDEVIVKLNSSLENSPEPSLSDFFDDFSAFDVPELEPFESDDLFEEDLDRFVDEWERHILVGKLKNGVRNPISANILRNKKKYKEPKLNPDRYRSARQVERERIESINEGYHIGRRDAKAEKKVGNKRRMHFPIVIKTTKRNATFAQRELESIQHAISRTKSESAQSASSSSSPTPPPATNAPVGLTYEQILELQTRELTPEDYELLLLLEASVPKKTLKSNDVKTFPTKSFSSSSSSNASDNTCRICMCDYEDGEQLTVLPCADSHSFHSSCINEWLTKSSVTCPLDGLSLERFL